MAASLEAAAPKPACVERFRPMRDFSPSQVKLELTKDGKLWKVWQVERQPECAPMCLLTQDQAGMRLGSRRSLPGRLQQETAERRCCRKARDRGVRPQLPREGELGRCSKACEDQIREGVCLLSPRAASNCVGLLGLAVGCGGVGVRLAAGIGEKGESDRGALLRIALLRLGRIGLCSAPIYL